MKTAEVSNTKALAVEMMAETTPLFRAVKNDEA